MVGSKMDPHPNEYQPTPPGESQPRYWQCDGTITRSYSCFLTEEE